MKDFVNPQETVYKLVAMLANGKMLNLTPAIVELSWAENQGELAAKAEIVLSNLATSDKSYVMKELALLTQIVIFADEETVFEGIIWAWEKRAEENEFSLTAYDKFIYMQKSKDNIYFGKGKKTGEIVKAICQKWSIPLSYDWVDHKHKQTAFRGSTIADMILQTLEEARKKTGKKYVAQFRNSALHIEHRGKNAVTYIFAPDVTTSASHTMTLDGFVTRVIVCGKEKKGKIPVKDTIDGQTKYGILQEIVNANDSFKDAKAEAKELLKERGEKPESDLHLECVDVPTIRKGDKVRLFGLSAINNGDYIVKSVNHDAVSRAMAMDVEEM